MVVGRSRELLHGHPEVSAAIFAQSSFTRGLAAGSDVVRREPRCPNGLKERSLRRVTPSDETDARWFFPIPSCN